jgi:GDPmannose 4,6-dehydratase
VKKAIIIGSSGQDGSYLTELLLHKSYEVHGTIRRNSQNGIARLENHLNNNKFKLHYCDIEDITSLRRILVSIEPDEIYHLAGQSHVGLSFEIPESTCESTAMGTLKLLEIIRDLKYKCRFLHTSSSEIFGIPATTPQNELTPHNPANPYGVAKSFATQMVKIYRQMYGLHLNNAICYNHESPRRGDNFVTKKIAKAVADIYKGRRTVLRLGNINSKRDWGHAKEYVEAMWRILQHDKPDDYIIATGQVNTVETLLDLAFRRLNLDWHQYVLIDNSLIRPAEPMNLVGDPSKINNVLGWKSTIDLEQLISEMVDHEIHNVK